MCTSGALKSGSEKRYVIDGKLQVAHSCFIRNKYVTLLFVATNHLICAFLRRVIIQMKRLGLNQTQLAKRMKVSRPYVTKLLSGDVNITFGTAMRLAQALQMDFFPDLREKTEPGPVAVPAAT